jgi:hypothetical protein
MTPHLEKQLEKIEKTSNKVILALHTTMQMTPLLHLRQSNIVVVRYAPDLTKQFKKLYPKIQKNCLNSFTDMIYL